MTTLVYRSSDPGAPVLSGQSHSLHNLLLQLLIGDFSGNAYGAGDNVHAAVGGWSVVAHDVDDDLLVMRNSLAHGGSGCVVELATGTRGATITVGGDYVDGVVIHPTWTQSVAVSDATNTTAREWFVIADELTCYVAVKPTLASLSGSGIIGFGDWVSFWPGDASRYMYLRSGFGVNERQLNNMAYLGTSNANSAGGAISTGGINSSLAEAKALVVGYGVTDTPTGWTLNTSLPATNPADGRIWTFPAYLRVDARNEISGRLRGVHMSPCVRDTGGLVEAIPGLLSESGGELLQVRHHTNVNDNLYTAVYFDKGAWP